VPDGSPAPGAGRGGLAARTGRVGSDERLGRVFLVLCLRGGRRSAATPTVVGVVPPGGRYVRLDIILGFPLYSLFTFGRRPRPTAGSDPLGAPRPLSLGARVRAGCPAVPPRPLPAAHVLVTATPLPPRADGCHGPEPESGAAADAAPAPQRRVPSRAAAAHRTPVFMCFSQKLDPQHPLQHYEPPPEPMKQCFLQRKLMHPGPVFVRSTIFLANAVASAATRTALFRHVSAMCTGSS